MKPYSKLKRFFASQHCLCENHATSPECPTFLPLFYSFFCLCSRQTLSYSIILADGRNGGGGGAALSWFLFFYMQPTGLIFEFYSKLLHTARKLDLHVCIPGKEAERSHSQFHISVSDLCTVFPWSVHLFWCSQIRPCVGITVHCRLSDFTVQSKLGLKLWLLQRRH